MTIPGGKTVTAIYKLVLQVIAVDTLRPDVNALLLALACGGSETEGNSWRELSWSAKNLSWYRTPCCTNEVSYREFISLVAHHAAGSVQILIKKSLWPLFNEVFFAKLELGSFSSIKAEKSVNGDSNALAGACITGDTAWVPWLFCVDAEALLTTLHITAWARRLEVWWLKICNLLFDHICSCDGIRTLFLYIGAYNRS